MKLIFAACVMLLFIPNRLLACSCIGESTVEDEIKQVDAVLVGTIIYKEIVTLSDTKSKSSFMDEMIVARYSLLVTAIYKGEITADTIFIYTGLGGGDCGNRFETGKSYIIYGEKEAYFGSLSETFNLPQGKNTYWTNICRRTNLYAEGEIVEIEKFAKRKTMRIE